MFAVLSKIKKLIQKKRGLVPVESEAATIMATMMPIPLDALDSKTAPLVATTTTSATTPVAVAGSEVSVVNQAEYEDRVFRLECPELACTLIAFNRCSPVLAKYILDFYEFQYEGLQTADMGPSMLARFKAECAYFQLPYHPVPRIIDQIMGNTLSEADKRSLQWIPSNFLMGTDHAEAYNHPVFTEFVTREAARLYVSPDQGNGFSMTCYIHPDMAQLNTKHNEHDSNDRGVFYNDMDHSATRLASVLLRFLQFAALPAHNELRKGLEVKLKEMMDPVNAPGLAEDNTHLKPVRVILEEKAEEEKQDAEQQDAVDSKLTMEMAEEILAQETRPDGGEEEEEADTEEEDASRSTDDEHVGDMNGHGSRSETSSSNNKSESGFMKIARRTLKQVRSVLSLPGAKKPEYAKIELTVQTTPVPVVERKKSTAIPPVPIWEKVTRTIHEHDKKSEFWQMADVVREQLAKQSDERRMYYAQFSEEMNRLTVDEVMEFLIRLTDERLRIFTQWRMIQENVCKILYSNVMAQRFLADLCLKQLGLVMDFTAQLIPCHSFSTRKQNADGVCIREDFPIPNRLFLCDNRLATAIRQSSLRCTGVLDREMLAMTLRLP